MKTISNLILIILTTTVMAGNPPIKTVDSLDIDRYLGKWYEIASYPHKFQKGCTYVTAEYSWSENKKYIVVKNSCTRDGKKTSVKAKGFTTKLPGQLKVQFFWPFKAKYWVIDLDENYQWAVVSHPSMNYLWVLCREPEMDEELYKEITARLEKQGFVMSKLTKTEQ